MVTTERKFDGVIHRNRMADIVDHWLFLIIFLIGAAGIIVLKLLDYRQLIVTSFPLLAMGVYLAYLYFSPRYYLREDRAGENLYYLGFLYTLTSLAFSLFVFTKSEVATGIIISNFGIALVTTILGLTLRVLFSQMREDPVEIEQEARMDLSTAVAELKSELDISVIELNSFRRATVQSIAEGVEEIGNKANSVLENSVSSYAEVTTDAIEKINKTFTEFSKNSSKLNKGVERTVGALENLFQRVEDIEAPRDLIATKLKPLIDGLLESVKQTIEQTKKEKEKIEPLKQIIESTAESSKQLKEHVQALSGEINNLQGALGKEFREFLQILSKESEDRNKTIDQQREHFKGTLTSLEQSGEDLLRAFRGGVTALDGLAKGADHDLTVIRRHRQELERELETSRKLVGDVHTSLVSMTSLIVEKINGR